MNLPNQPILIFSEYCQHSTNFLKILIKHPEIYNSIIRLCIDVEINTKLRPKTFYQLQQILQVKITHVPTIITVGGQHILSDKEAFKWLESVIKANSNSEIGGFNPLEMTSFSDGYAAFGSTDLNDCAKEQSFKFFKDGLGEDYNCTIQDGKPNFQEEELSTKTNNNEFARKQQERDSMDQSIGRNGNMGRLESPQKINNKIGQHEYSNKLHNRNNFNQGSKAHSPIDFTNINFGLESKLSNVDPRFKQSEKQKLLDKRLEQLIADRSDLN